MLLQPAGYLSRDNGDEGVRDSGSSGRNTGYTLVRLPDYRRGNIQSQTTSHTHITNLGSPINLTRIYFVQEM